MDVERGGGSRLLIESASFGVNLGDKVGFVGRNGAGKTTLTKTLAGEGQPAAGSVTHSGMIGYLPQDPQNGDLEVLAGGPILSARAPHDALRHIPHAARHMLTTPRP